MPSNRTETTGTSPRPNVISEEPHGKIIALSLLLAFLWGGNSPSIKVGLQDFPPMALAFLRFAIGLVVVGGWSFYRGVSVGLRRGEFARLLLLTAIFILQIICLNTGTLFTTASRSTIFINVYPFFTALFAHFWIPAERLSVTKTLGIIVAFSGVFITVAPNLGEGEASILGDILVLVSGCFLRVTRRRDKATHSSDSSVSALGLVFKSESTVLCCAESVTGAWEADGPDVCECCCAVLSRWCYRWLLFLGVDFNT